MENGDDVDDDNANGLKVFDETDIVEANLSLVALATKAGCLNLDDNLSILKNMDISGKCFEGDVDCQGM